MCTVPNLLLGKLTKILREEDEDHRRHKYLHACTDIMIDSHMYFWKTFMESIDISPSVFDLSCSKNFYTYIHGKMNIFDREHQGVPKLCSQVAFGADSASSLATKALISTTMLLGEGICEAHVWVLRQRTWS